MSNRKNEPHKHIYIEAVLSRDYIDSEYFLPTGTTIFIFPGRKFIFSLNFFSASGKFHYITRSMIATMTEDEMRKKEALQKARLTFLEADKLYFALSAPERKIIWPQKKIRRR
jgi:hypothetical protein